MPISKPYHHLWRPMKGYNWVDKMMADDDQKVSLEYLEDNLFANQAEKISLVTTAHLIIHDLYEIFNFIEPDDNNLNVFSHRIYELFLRATTEVEANLKGILVSNGYRTGNQNLKMDRDYFRIAQVAKLSDYKVTFNRWSSNHVFVPFAAWNSTIYAPLIWYQDYNDIKHDRYQNFKKANLDNLMNALSGLLSLLHAQYGDNMASACYEGISSIQNEQCKLVTDSFTIVTPSFSNQEQYEFIWNNIKTDSIPVDNYQF